MRLDTEWIWMIYISEDLVAKRYAGVEDLGFEAEDDKCDI